MIFVIKITIVLLINQEKDKYFYKNVKYYIINENYIFQN